MTLSNQWRRAVGVALSCGIFLGGIATYGGLSYVDLTPRGTADHTLLSSSLASISALKIGSQGVLLQADSTPSSFRVVGGHNAKLAQAKFFVALDFNVGRSNEWSCGGTAISRRWVLTAAHCVMSGRKIVSQKRSRVVTRPQTHQEKSVRVDRIMTYSKSPFTHDIALVRASRSLNVMPIRYDGSRKYFKKHRKFRVLGLGEIQGSRWPARLQEGYIVDRAGRSKICGNYGRDYERRYMLCAGDPDGTVDACTGDSGGPLITRTGRRALVGIVAFGDRCGSRDYPGIYTRVSTYANWIAKSTGVKPVTIKK